MEFYCTFCSRVETSTEKWRFLEGIKGMMTSLKKLIKQVNVNRGWKVLIKNDVEILIEFEVRIKVFESDWREVLF